MIPQLNQSPKNVIINEINETIISNAESFYDVIEILIDGLQALGVKISFTSYPNQYSDLVSNTHNAPKGYPSNCGSKSDLPKGYPGVIGRWSGTVELINDSYFSRTPSFGDIASLFPFLKTGTGGVGCNFSISGMMFVYDFPRMKELFKQDIDKQVKLLTNAYCSKVEAINKKHAQERTKYIQSNAKMISIDTLIGELTELTKKSNDIKMALRSELHKKFNEENNIKLEKAPQHFIKDDPRHELICANSSTHSSSEINKLAAQANEIKKQMDELISNFPENFI